MKAFVTKRIEVDVEITPELLAAAFCDMNDEQQAQFFIECAAMAGTWNFPQWTQWALVGGHLRDCACSTPEAREMVSAIADGMKTR